MRKQDRIRSGRAAAVIICAGRATRNTLPTSLLLYWRGFVPYHYQPHKNNALAARGVETLPLPEQRLPTTVVGSYPQPDWLVDRAMLSKSVPRTRMTGMWRIPEAYLEQAQDDATVVELRDMEFLRRNTDRAAKITLPGPFTMGQQARDEFYKDDEALAMALAEAVNAEALQLQQAGADVIQLDEPWVRNDPAAAKRYAVKAINRALRGITVPTVVHICFGYAAVVPGDTKPSGYSFLAELADSSAEQISIEAAQPKLDLGVLADLSAKKIMLGVIDLGNH